MLASPLEDETEALNTGPAIAEVLGHHRQTRPYFELLVVATMTEAQEQALAGASGLRS